MMKLYWVHDLNWCDFNANWMVRWILNRWNMIGANSDTFNAHGFEYSQPEVLLRLCNYFCFNGRCSIYFIRSNTNMSADNFSFWQLYKYTQSVCAKLPAEPIARHFFHIQIFNVKFVLKCTITFNFMRKKQHEIWCVPAQLLFDACACLKLIHRQRERIQKGKKHRNCIESSVVQRFRWQ